LNLYSINLEEIFLNPLCTELEKEEDRMRIDNYWGIISVYTDPDSGEKRESMIAFSFSESHAKLICFLLKENDPEPNRDYLYKRAEK